MKAELTQNFESYGNRPLDAMNRNLSTIVFAPELFRMDPYALVHWEDDEALAVELPLSLSFNSYVELRRESPECAY